MITMNNEFYIGWMPKAPQGFARHVKRVLLTILPVVLLTGATLAWLQKRFSTASFEFGKLTEVTGVYFKDPVPMLRVNAGNDIWGNASYISIPLVGYGKHGANGIIREIEIEHKTSLDHKQVTLKGTLLYTDGRTIMQVSSNDIASVKIIPGRAAETATVQKDLGFRKVKGEIIDPKCYFGVMKPGEGKVHRDCAIRCILGGIPPMMHVWNDKGESNYYILVSSTGIDINKAVQDYVAEPVELEARLVQYGDWTLMYVADMKNIRPISSLQLFRPASTIIACGTGCTQ